MGEVFLAEHTILEKKVAIKALHGYVATNEATVRRFYREAQTAGNLSHPNIVTIFDADEDPEAQISFIAMEFIEGQSLQQLLDGDRIFTPEETLEIVLQIAGFFGKVL